MHLERVEHALARDDDLLGLLLDGQAADEGRDLLRRLPLRELAQSFLPRPDGRVHDLEEQLPRAGIEHEDGPVDGLRREVPFKRLVDGHAVDVRVVDEPNNLIAKELAVVLRTEVGLRRLGAVELEALADALPQNVEGGVGFHDLRHGLLDERLAAGEPRAVPTIQVVGQVDGDERARRRRVDAHVVRRVVQKLGPRVALDVVAVEVAPPQLDVEPVFGRRRAVVAVLRVVEERRFRDLPLVGREEQNVRAARVHFIRFARVDRLFLHIFDLERVELLVEHLAQVHGHGLVDLLPEVRAEDLDQRDLQRRDLPVHEDAREVELDLEPHIHVRPVDRRRPPQREPSIGNLIETRPLRVRQFFVLHGLFKTRRFFPEEALPRREVRALEQRVLEDALDAAEGLDHVRAVVV
mmetsp:Transcript_3144/g.9017  ORF Transcript_3144/g.9017 Transcript_3144/m.9017 type:complete len:409 (-) Transcript_3144:4863-6089(-)